MRHRSGGSCLLCGCVVSMQAKSTGRTRTGWAAADVGHFAEDHVLCVSVTAQCSIVLHLGRLGFSRLESNSYAMHGAGCFVSVFLLRPDARDVGADRSSLHGFGENGPFAETLFLAICSSDLRRSLRRCSVFGPRPFGHSTVPGRSCVPRWGQVGLLQLVF